MERQHRANKQTPSASLHKTFFDDLATLGRNSIMQQVIDSDLFTGAQKKTMRLYFSSVNNIIKVQMFRPELRIEPLVGFNLDFLSVTLPVTTLCTAAQLQDYIKVLCLFADAIMNLHGKNGPLYKIPHFNAMREVNLNESLLHAAINVRILTDALAKKPEMSETMTTEENKILLNLTAQQDENSAVVKSLSANEVFERYKSKALLYLNTAERDEKIDDTAQYSPNDRFIMQSLTLSNTLVKPCYHMARAALSTLVETLEENKKEAKVNAFTNGCRKDSQYQSFADSAKASTECSLPSQDQNETDSLLVRTSTGHESLPEKNFETTKSISGKGLRHRQNVSSINRN